MGIGEVHELKAIERTVMIQAGIIVETGTEVPPIPTRINASPKRIRSPRRTRPLSRRNLIAKSGSTGSKPAPKRERNNPRKNRILPPRNSMRKWTSTGRKLLRKKKKPKNLQRRRSNHKLDYP